MLVLMRAREKMACLICLSLPHRRSLPTLGTSWKNYRTLTLQIPIHRNLCLCMLSKNFVVSSLIFIANKVNKIVIEENKRLKENVVALSAKIDCLNDKLTDDREDRLKFETELVEALTQENRILCEDNEQLPNRQTGATYF